MKAIVLVVLFGFTLPGKLEAVASSCYQCNTVTDKSCGDPFDTSGSIQPTSCPSVLKGYCMKTKTTGGGQTVVSRSCFPSCQGASGSAGTISCCDTDNCNAGMMTSFSIITIMTSLLMAYFAKARF